MSLEYFVSNGIHNVIANNQHMHVLESGNRIVTNDRRIMRIQQCIIIDSRRIIANCHHILTNCSQTLTNWHYILTDCSHTLTNEQHK